MKRLNKKELQLIADATIKKSTEIGLEHAKKNAPYIKRTIKDIKIKNALPAIVIAAGPSLHRKKSILKIRKINFKVHKVAVDGTLGHCLRNGVIPDFVITVDPHPHRIVRWFGDTRLSERPDDDYFKRQDLDPALNRDEAARNKELVKLVNRYGPKIKAIISTSVTPDITKRCIEAGMELYWWNPLYDDYEKPDGNSKRVYQMTSAPCMVTGGNCGTSAWVFSHAILKSPYVFMVGMDFSYPINTAVEKTQYYEALKEIFGEEPKRGLIKVYNPHLRQIYLTDPTYYWYNRSFIQMARYARCKTYNCTEGGILFGQNIEFISLKNGLQILKKISVKKGI